MRLNDLRGQSYKRRYIVNRNESFDGVKKSNNKKT